MQTLETVLAEDVVVLRTDDGYAAFGQYSHRSVATDSTLDAILRRCMDDMGAHGGTLTLGPGEFVLGAPLDLADDVCLRGSGPATRLRCESADSEAVLRAENARGVTISDLTVTAGRGAARPRNGVVLRSCVSGRIDRAVVVGFPEDGIRVCEGSALCDVNDCTAAGNGAANIALRELHIGPYGDFVPNRVSRCTVYGGGVGYDCQFAIVANFCDCIAYQTGGSAYLIRDRSSSVAVTGCRSFQTGDDAVRVVDSNETCLTGNVFCWQTGHGVVISNARWGTVTGNQVIDSGSFNSGEPLFQTKLANLATPPPHRDGIRLSDASGFTVTGNAVFNFGVAPKLAVGVREDDTSRDNVIAANNVNYYLSDPTDTNGKGSITVDTVGYADRPHKNPERSEPGEILQSFQPERVAELIQKLL